MPSPKLVPLLLTDGERDALALRARIVLACAERTGVSRKITDEQVQVVVTRVLTEQDPGPGVRWSTRSMAGQAGLSQSSVSRIWRTFGLKPSWPGRSGSARTRSSSRRPATSPAST